MEPLKTVGTETENNKNMSYKSILFLKNTSPLIKANLEMRAEMVVNVPDEEGKRVK